MKIAIIGPAHPFRGGIATYNERFALELQNQGHEVSIYTFTLQYPNFLFPGKTQFSDTSKPNNLLIKRKINSVNPLNWLKVGRLLRNEKPDLVIVRYWLPFMGPCFGTILRKIKKNNHSKIIALVDNIVPHESRIGDKGFTRFFVKPVDAFLTMSKNVFDDINQFDVKKPKALSPHPLFDNFGEEISKEQALKKLGLDENYKYILFFGLIRKYKGLDLLLQAFTNEKLKERPIKLIIAGEYYSSKEEYSSYIEQHGLKNRVIEIDQFIPDSEVKNYFCACDLVVQPYRSATQSGVTQIAYHFNKAMIVTDVGGLSEMCPDGKTGYVVQKNPEEIAAAILRYFDHTDHQVMYHNILEQKKKYSWEILVKNTFDLMNKI